MKHILTNANALAMPLPAKSVQAVITSPPYFGLRDYGIEGQLGAEATPAEFVLAMVAFGREVWRVLKDDGLFWLNLGDSYAGGTRGSGGLSNIQNTNIGSRLSNRQHDRSGMVAKNLIGIPWRAAFALQDDGWILRQDIIWHKPAPMPESVTDRCTKAHEYIFMFAKRGRYYYDAAAIAEQAATGWNGSKFTEGKTKDAVSHLSSVGQGARNEDSNMRNRRSVWTVHSASYRGAHFATWPPALVQPMVLASTRQGDIVLDPFCGSGTTGVVCEELGRQFVGLDLNYTYLDQHARVRVNRETPRGAIEKLPLFHIAP